MSHVYVAKGSMGDARITLAEVAYDISKDQARFIWQELGAYLRYPDVQKDNDRLRGEIDRLTRSNTGLRAAATRRKKATK